MTSLVFPTFNPGPGVAATVAAARGFLRARPDLWEVLFVCDGCTDGTPARLARLLAGDRRMRAVTYAPNRGKGHAVRAGLLAARGAVRVFADVDLAYQFDDIARVADAVAGGAAVAVGSRDHPDSRVLAPTALLCYLHKRRRRSRQFSRLVRLLVPVGLNDTQAGLKGMTAAVAEAVLPNLACDGFGFDCELLTACRRYGVAVTEVPVTVRYADAATSTGGLRTAVRMLADLWRVRRRWPAAGFPPPWNDECGMMNDELKYGVGWALHSSFIIHHSAFLEEAA